MDDERVKQLREEFGDKPGLPLLLYLDLPEEEVERWQDNQPIVFALSARLSTLVREVLDTCSYDDKYGLDDDAARAIRLLVSLSVDQQKALEPVMESYIAMFFRMRDAREAGGIASSQPFTDPFLATAKDDDIDVEAAIQFASDFLRFPTAE